MTISNLSSQLIVPITLWGSRSPTHCISSILLSADYRTIITGCNDGQICIWDLSDDRKTITPRSLLFGHSSAVLCLANGKQTGDLVNFVSSSESGEMSLWDLNDGRCIETVKHHHVHTNIHTYMMNHDDVRFFCNGYYAEILVIDGLTLEVLFTLNSKLNPDWISAIHVLRPSRAQDDVVIGLSIAGVMKVWTLNGGEQHALEPIYENESKPIRCLNALQLACCVYNQRTLMIVCAKYWQIYDVGDFALLCSVDNRRGERWAGGDFLAADRVVIWSDVGRAYMYRLPVHKLKGKAISSCLPESAEYRKPDTKHVPFLYGTLLIPKDDRLLCPPAMAFYNLCRVTSDHGLSVQIPRIVLRGDSYGRIALWNVPDISNWDLISDKQLEVEPGLMASLSTAWRSMKVSPCGIIDNLLKRIEQDAQMASPLPANLQHNDAACGAHHRDAHGAAPAGGYKLTSSVYIPALGRLVCGREDGSIIIVSANQTIMLQLLLGRHLSYDDWPHHQILYGHSGRVNTLLYPHQLEDRYEVSHLVSGGVDFSVCLWDIFTGTLLHRFSVHAGEITQMFAPPKECSPRVLACICSVASDHSVALISLKERKCVMLASRHLFPISTIKWRPLDDFMIVGCVDGSVYVWQMETGHLDRVLHGMTADEILNACDGNAVATAGDRFVNPVHHLFRGLRHRNLAAIKQAAVRGLHNISAHLAQQRLDVVDVSLRNRCNPLLIQGLRTNPKDQESHILFFDVESLIVQLMSEEYDRLSPNTLESRGLTNNLEYRRYADMANSPETQHKLSGFLSKMKDTAENAAQKIQAKAESVGFKNVSGDISVGFHRKTSNTSTASEDPSGSNLSRSGSIGAQGKPSATTGTGADANGYTGEMHMPMEIARLLMSLLHAWGLDPDLDKVCEAKLGLLRPLRPVCFGQISKGGHMSLLLPTYLNALDDQLKSEATPQPPPPPQHQAVSRTKSDRHVKMCVSGLSSELQVEEEMARRFTSKLHWEFSSALTTNHLLSLVSMALTMRNMSDGTSFVRSADFAETNRRKLIRKLSRQGSASGYAQPPPQPPTTISADEEERQRLAATRDLKAQIRESWALFRMLHGEILPVTLSKAEPGAFKRPLVELLARRWQDRCVEIREAAQYLLEEELKAAGSKGRRAIVDEWSVYLPVYSDLVDAPLSGGQQFQIPRSQATAIPGGTSTGPHSMSSSPMPSPMSDSSHHMPANHHDDHHGHPNNVGSDGEDGDEDDDEMHAHLNSSIRAANLTSGSEGRRRQATAIILMGVIGCLYGSEITNEAPPTHQQPPPPPVAAKTPPPRPPRPGETPQPPPPVANGGPAQAPNQLQLPAQQQRERRRSLIEGFGGGGNYSLARKTSKALSYLLLAPPTSQLPYHTSLRRAAIDLIGRGFTVWEPYLDVSKILYALLEFCAAEGDATMIPTSQFGLPLTAIADSCRAARESIEAIARVRPSVFITTIAREVTRYNTMQQQQQALNIIPHQTVLYKARPEILKNLQRLFLEEETVVYNLSIEATDIVMYCLDHNALKTRGLGEMFPSICAYHNITYCTNSKRVAVGAKNGNLAIHELKTGKSQLIAAHAGHPITACAFAPDGKHLASYCAQENRVSFWLTAVGLFGLGKSQTQCVKWHQSPPMPAAVRAVGLKAARLVWVSSKLLILLFANGEEHRFNI